MAIKVRLNQVKNNRYRCWIDGSTSYYYGRSLVDYQNLTPEFIQKEQNIEIWLKQTDADFVKQHVGGCFPEWLIDFKKVNDITMFKIKWVD